MPAEALVRARVAAGTEEALAWADGLDVSVPESLWAAVAAHGRGADGELRITRDAAPLAHAAVERVRLRAAFTPPPVSSRLPFSYRSVPGPLRRAAARAVGRVQRHRTERWAAFPAWPLDVSVDVLADWGALGRDDGFTKADAPVPVLLTHDIDSAEGLRRLASDFLPLEEAVGARSTSFVVPCAWPLDLGCLAEVKARGHLLGIHGYDHANRTPFAVPAERRARLDAARPLAEQFGMAGYRAPSLLRTPELLADLGGRFRYDSSVPTSGGLFPVPNNGCATVRPFAIGAVHEIPITLPRDGSLLFLGHEPDEILAIWQRCAELAARARGVVVLLTHCEPHFSGDARMLRTYRSFLEWVRDNRRFTWSTPADVLTAA